MSFVSFLQFFALLSLAAGKPILLPRQVPEAPQADAQNLVDVQLHSLGNTAVRALITNTGDEALQLVKRGGILDSLPTRKAIVSGRGETPTFTGAEVTYVSSHLSPDAFVTLAPNQTTESTFDIADFHNLSGGKQYSAIADGLLEYTKPNNPKKFSFVPYKSNKITISGPKNAETRLSSRATLTGCSQQYNDQMQKNLARAAKMATAAAADARSGSAIFQKFFKSKNNADMKEVSGRLDAIAKEATTKGTLTYYCQASAQDGCGGNIAAITYPSQNRVVNCQPYYETQAVVDQCDYLDQASISLHEFSHATSVYAPGTDDVVYGLQGVLSLNTEQAKNNADTFAYYSSYVFKGCSADGTGSSGQSNGNSGGGSTSPNQGTNPTSGVAGTPGTGTETGTVTGPNGGNGVQPWPQGGTNQGSSTTDNSGTASNDGAGLSPWGEGNTQDSNTQGYTQGNIPGNTQGTDLSGYGQPTSSWGGNGGNSPWSQPSGQNQDFSGNGWQGGNSGNTWPSSAPPAGAPAGTPFSTPWGNGGNDLFKRKTKQ